MTELAGKRAVVTGASRGIGAAIAHAFAQRGADVAITYAQSTDRAAEVVRMIEAQGRRGFAFKADSADPKALKTSIDEAAKALGGIDILVNNAGIALYHPVADVSIDAIDAQLAVNVRAPILAVQAALQHFGGEGRVITIGSAGAERIVGEGLTVYYATKSALHAFTRGLARELGRRNVTVNLVQPGSTDTEMNPANGEYAAFQRELSALGRYGDPEDVAAAVAFLASPAARHITGSIVTVDGGQTA